MPSELCYLDSLDRSVLNTRGAWLLYIIITIHYKNVHFSVNSVDPDQTPRTAASDQGLNCLPVTVFLWDAGHKEATNPPALSITFRHLQVLLHGHVPHIICPKFWHTWHTVPVLKLEQVHL